MTYTCLICGSNNIHTIEGLYDDRYGAPGIYKVFACNECGFGKTDPALTDDMIPSFYAKYYPLKRMTVSGVFLSQDKHSRFQRWLLGVDNVAHQYIKKDSTVLDIGSASGVSLLEINSFGAIAFGVEPDPNAQYIARALGLNVFQGLITDNPFPNMKFDYVTASQVIEHSVDPNKFLNSVKGRLAKNGKVILSFPNINSIYRIIFGKRWINWHVPYHQNFFSKESIEKLAEDNGFVVEQVKTITPNLWTSLQIINFFVRPKRSLPNFVWAENSTNLNKNKSFKYFIAATMKIVWFLSIPINRVVDQFGFGDSILIILDKK